MSEYGRPPVHINIEKAYKDAVKAIKKELKKQDADLCPFCGNKGTHLEDLRTGAYWMTCNRCGATGPATSTKEEAKKAWRKRAWKKR